jgi:hypothetical protein
VANGAPRSVARSAPRRNRDRQQTAWRRISGGIDDAWRLSAAAWRNAGGGGAAKRRQRYRRQAASRQAGAWRAAHRQSENRKWRSAAASVAGGGALAGGIKQTAWHKTWRQRINGMAHGKTLAYALQQRWRRYRVAPSRRRAARGAAASRGAGMRG